MLASGLISVLLALVMVYLAMLLTYERTERKLYQSQRQLRFLADTDTLTEVPNRRRFYELATRALALGAPGRSAVVMFDLDHFKHINDLHGHAEGDEALREVARCTREMLRALRRGRPHRRRRVRAAAARDDRRRSAGGRVAHRDAPGRARPRRTCRRSA